MSEENKINQQANPSQPIEDVFSSVDSVDDNPAPPSAQENTPQAAIKEDINISEASIGQEEISTPEQKLEPVKEDKKNQGINRNKIFFYLILALIVLLGVFAIWVLMF